MAYKNKHLLSHVFHGLGIWCGLAECLCFQVSHKAEIKVASVAVISRINQAWISQAHSSGCWLNSVPSRVLDGRPEFLAKGNSP